MKYHQVVIQQTLDKSRSTVELWTTTHSKTRLLLPLLLNGSPDVRNAMLSGLPDVRNAMVSLPDVRNAMLGGLPDVRNAMLGGFHDIRNAIAGGSIAGHV